ncbi:MAG TPA: DUF924 family protein [Polyangiales bacterium]|nr:DUF924 family protein [Polyangiales bacterium]
MTVTVAPEDVLWFWLGDLDGDGLAEQALVQRWWRKDAELDLDVRSKFEATWQAIMAGDREDWLPEPHGCLAYVIVLDQFSRNMFRGSAQAFAGDERALRVAADGVEAGLDRRLHGHERVFLYMPFMHSESLAMQDRAIELFSALTESARGRAKDAFAGNLEFARQHRDIVARFGRFPHRNAILGRESTPEEEAFLKLPGSSF